MSTGPNLPERITFGRFCLVPRHREFLVDGKPATLGGRAFDLLTALIEVRGSVVSKDALLERVWRGRVVEENNLEVQISTLRSILGDDRGLIRTVSGRGYQFAGEIDADRETHIDASPDATLPATNLPQLVSGLIGRDDTVPEILRLSATHRLMTLIGTGGIGKTRLALEAARRLLPNFTGGAWFVDLTTLSDPGIVPAAVAAAIGLEPGAGVVTAERVAQALDGRSVLLLLDNCEHLIDAAAAMAEALSRANRSAHIIATSREPLLAEGEQVFRVPPLAVPPADGGNGSDPLEYGAIRLFVERALAAEPRFAPDERLMAMLVTICQRLDGIPLAIELAAARVGTLGIEDLTVRLDDRLRLLTGGRRTAQPRHQTLRATMDWSHELLSEPERVLLRQLAIFAGLFTLDAAVAVATAPLDTVEGLSSLVAKSLVARDLASAGGRYRLLETTRAYALEKLAESGERDRIARRHAEYYRDLFERAETEWHVRPAAEWLGEYGWRTDNLRAALDWAFSVDGDASIGVALTTAAVPLWMHLSLLEECRGRVEQALAALQAGADQDARREMKLSAALGGSLLFTKGPMHEIDLAWNRTLSIARSLADREYELRALWGLWVLRNHTGEFGAGLRFAERFRALVLARGDAADLAVADRMVGVSLHYRGDQTDARRHIECMLARYVAPVRRSPSARFVYDQKAIAQLALARILWVQGFPDRAWSIARRNVEDALALNNPFNLCFTLQQAACPIAFFIGDLGAAERYVAMLLDRSAAHGLPVWLHWGQCFQATLAIWNGAVETGLPLLLSAIGQPSTTDYQTRFTWFVGQLADGFRRGGRIAEGTARIDEAISRCERNEDHWCLAELLRIKGDLLLPASDATAEAERLFRRALDLARQQDALSWELRAAVSLARLLGDQRRPRDAYAVLRPVYDRFSEGFGSADLKSARALLAATR